jgi:hypothetical protein
VIKIPQPAMALNAEDVPGATYKMWNTWKVPSTERVDHILDWCSVVAGGTSTGCLHVLLINCHGFYGSNGKKSTGGFGLKLGTGIRRADTGKFSKLKGKVLNIWITACGTARITNPGTASDGDGNLFCQEIARSSGAYVVAATTHQVGDVWLPYGYVDDFEGLVLRYNPSGVLDWSQNYNRGMIDGLINGWD